MPLPWRLKKLRRRAPKCPILVYSGSKAGDNLQSIPAKDIERIEVLTTPPPQFKADGAAGVINIILRKDFHSQGFTARLDTRTKSLSRTATTVAVRGSPVSSAISPMLSPRVISFSVRPSLATARSLPPSTK